MKHSFVFTVQGEGRGHLTQAIAVYELLTSRGHTVSAVLIGTSSRRKIPGFVEQRIKAPIITYQSPNFVVDKENKSIQPGKTFFHCLKNWKTYSKSIQTIRRTIDLHQPDILLNFYEPLTGIASLRKPLHPNIISIAHQFLYLHPEFDFPKESKKSDAWSVYHYTKLVSKGSAKLIALSFYPVKQTTYKNIIVSPPVLRKEVFEQDLFNGNRILVYILNSGYMQEIIEWNKLHPDVILDCFTDSAAVKGTWQYSDSLCFHSLDDKKFLRFMSQAKALVTTAGFESVCEAMYMGKPTLMVPVKGHFEQWCNARDAMKAGAGIYADRFHLDSLLEYIPQHKKKDQQYTKWIYEAGRVLMQTIGDVLQEPMEELTEERNTQLFPFTSPFGNQQLGTS